MVDAKKGLTIERTPTFNISSLANTPYKLTDAKGSDFNTTYTQANIADYPLDTTYVKKMLDRHYYSIFYVSAPQQACC